MQSSTHNTSMQPTAGDMSLSPEERREINMGVAVMTAPTVCCGLVCLGLVLAVDISCVVIGYQDHWECDGKGAVVADLQTFAKLAGYAGLAMFLLGVICKMCLFPMQKDGVISFGNIRANRYIQGLFSLAFLVLSIIGFVEYGSTSKDCQQAPLGEVVLAWAILKILGPVMFGIGLICHAANPEVSALSSGKMNGHTNGHSFES